MAIENDMQTFSVRLPRSLVAQVDQRAALARRSRNAEIQVLVETAIDLHVLKDKKLAEAHASASGSTA